MGTSTTFPSQFRGNNNGSRPAGRFKLDGPRCLQCTLTSNVVDVPSCEDQIDNPPGGGHGCSAARDGPGRQGRPKIAQRLAGSNSVQEAWAANPK
jgi:hypothetical protein